MQILLLLNIEVLNMLIRCILISVNRRCQIVALRSASFWYRGGLAGSFAAGGGSEAGAEPGGSERLSLFWGGCLKGHLTGARAGKPRPVTPRCTRLVPTKQKGRWISKITKERAF